MSKTLTTLDAVCGFSTKNVFGIIVQYQLLVIMNSGQRQLNVNNPMPVVVDIQISNLYWRTKSNNAPFEILFIPTDYYVPVVCAISEAQMVFYCVFTLYC